MREVYKYLKAAMDSKLGRHREPDVMDSKSGRHREPDVMYMRSIGGAEAEVPAKLMAMSDTAKHVSRMWDRANSAGVTITITIVDEETERDDTHP